MKKYWSIILLSGFIILFFLDPVYADTVTRYDSLVVDAFSDKVFASALDAKGIDVIDIENGKLATILPDKEIKTMALDQQVGIIAAIDQDNDFLIISTGTFNILASIPVEGEVTSVAIDPALRLSVFTLAEGKIGFVDLDTYAAFSEIEALDEPISVAVDPQLHVAAVAHNTWGNGNDIGGAGNEPGRDNVTIIDLATRSIIKTLQAGKNPVEAVVNSITHDAVVANEKGDDLTLIDLTNLLIEGNIDVGKHPKTLSFNECLNTLAVAGGEDRGWMQVIDLNTRGNDAGYDLEDKPDIIKVHQYLNKAIVAGKGGLTISDLPNPVPEIVSIDPEKVLRGEESLDLLLGGRGLLEITGIYLDGNNVSSTLEGCGVMNVNVPGEYLENTGEIEISAKNPLPDGGTSSPVYLRIDNPVPVISVLDPVEVIAGAPGVVIDAYGAGYFSDTSLYVDGVAIPFTLGSQTKLQIELGAEDLECGGYLEITASNPMPGGGSSAPAVFTVLNSVPELAALSPSSIIAGNRDLDLTLTGGNFVKTSLVSLNNQQYPVRYVSKTQVEAAIPADAIKTPGNYPVKVINPPPGGGETQTLIFTVKPPVGIEITSPLDGETVNETKTIVKGTIQSDMDNVGVVVNGVLADVRGRDWVADGVPLSLGTNTITAKITDAAGNVASSSINVNAVNTIQHVRLYANVTSGIAPLTTSFLMTAEMADPITSYRIDFDGDGVIDYSGTTFEDVSYTYTADGFFYPTISITDSAGNSYSDTIAITAMKKEQIDSLIKSEWEGLKGALSEKDTEKALGYFVDRSKERYGRIFAALKDQLPVIMDTFIEFNITDYYDGIAEYEIVADENGVLYSYPGLLVKDGSGIWKFRDF